MNVDASLSLEQPTKKRTGTAEVPGFSKAERDRRWNVGRRIMREKDLDALIVFGSREGAFPAPYSMDNFFTNDRPGAIVVFPRDREPYVLAFVLAANDHMQALRRGEEVWIRPDHFFGGAPNGEALVKVMQRLELGKSRTGVLGLDPYPPFYFDGPMPYNTWKTVLDAFPEAEFEGVGERFFQLTATRSEEELAVIEWSAQTGEAMCAAMLEATCVGATEAEIYAAIVEVCPRRVGFTGEILLGSGKEIVGFGPPTWNYRPHAPRVVEDGDVVTAELFASLGMLETQHQCTVAVGNVHEDYERAAKVARASYQAGLGAARPGRTFGQVVAAMQAPLRQVGAHPIHPLIHSINPFGLICGFGEGFARLAEAKRYALTAKVPTFGGDVPLQPGMTFSFEPSCLIGKRFVNLGGTVVVGEQGAIELNEISTRMLRVPS